MKKSTSLMAMIIMVMLVIAPAVSFAGDPVADPVEKVSTFKAVISWIVVNQASLLATVAATLAALAAICKFTPTPKDDAVIARLLKWLNMIPDKK